MSLYLRCPAYDQWFDSLIGGPDGVFGIADVLHAIRPVVRLPGDLIVHESLGSVAATQFGLSCSDLGGMASLWVSVGVWLMIFLAIGLGFRWRY